MEAGRDRVQVSVLFIGASGKVMGFKGNGNGNNYL